LLAGQFAVSLKRLKRKLEGQRMFARARRDGGAPKGQRFEIGVIGENVAGDRGSVAASRRWSTSR
jgi:hypothetical protein